MCGSCRTTIGRANAYRAPIDLQAETRWIAAFEPVIITTLEQRQLRDPGWVVVVQQRVD